jgi:hypothetical protein
MVASCMCGRGGYDESMSSMDGTTATVACTLAGALSPRMG